MNPRPHAKVPGLAAREHRVLQHSLPHQSGKAFPELGMLLQRSERSISASCQFSVLEPAAVCTGWEARNAGELQYARITRAPELRQTRRGLKLQLLSPFHEFISTQVLRAAKFNLRAAHALPCVSQSCMEMCYTSHLTCTAFGMLPAVQLHQLLHAGSILGRLVSQGE